MATQNAGVGLPVQRYEIHMQHRGCMRRHHPAVGHHLRRWFLWGPCFVFLMLWLLLMGGYPVADALRADGSYRLGDMLFMPVHLALPVGVTLLLWPRKRDLHTPPVL